MGGVSTRNFKVFRKLCGENTLRNVVIVTNMWGEVDRSVGESREAELRGGDDFFKPALERGAQMARHENTALSAQGIIRLILHNHPLPLRIQEELVTEGKGVINTDAGGELNQELNAQIKKNEEHVHALKEEARKVQKQDKQTMEELEWMLKKAEEDAQKLREEKKKLQKGVLGMGAALAAIGTVSGVTAAVMSGDPLSGFARVGVLSGAATIVNVLAGIYSRI